jgi:hypothetical protein
MGKGCWGPSLPILFPGRGAAQSDALQTRDRRMARIEIPKTPDQRCTTHVLHRVRGTQ